MTQARLNISLPGLPREVAQALADAGHENEHLFRATEAG
jgi:hypothetical protein